MRALLGDSCVVNHQHSIAATHKLVRLNQQFCLQRPGIPDPGSDEVVQLIAGALSDTGRIHDDMMTHAKWHTISWRTGTKGKLKARFAAVAANYAVIGPTIFFHAFAFPVVDDGRWRNRNNLGSAARHPTLRWMAATLDGRVAGSGAVFEAKFMLPWSFSEEAAAHCVLIKPTLVGSHLGWVR